MVAPAAGRAACCLWASLALAACGKLEPLEIALPELGDASAVILAIERGGPDQELVVESIEAFEPARPPTSRHWELEDEERLKLSLVVYPEGATLGRLGLVDPEQQQDHEVPLRLSAGGDYPISSIRGYVPRAIWVSSEVVDGRKDWRSERLSEGLEKHVLVGKSPNLCEDVSPARVLVDGVQSSVPFIVAAPELGVFVFGTSFRQADLIAGLDPPLLMALRPSVESGSHLERIRFEYTVGDPLDPPVWGGIRAPDGDFWLAGREDRVYRGRLREEGSGGLVMELIEETRLSSETSRSFQPYREARPEKYFAVGAAGVPFELYVLAMNGTFQRFDGSRWQMLFDLEEPPVLEDARDHGGVAWLGPQEALAVSLYQGSVVHVSGDEVELEAVPYLTPDEAASTVSTLEQGRAVLGTSQGNIFERVRPGVWEHRVKTGGVILGEILPSFGPGLLIGGDDGFLAWDHPRLGLLSCEAGQGVVHSIRHFSRMGDLVLAAGTRQSREAPSPLSVTVLSAPEE